MQNERTIALGDPFGAWLSQQHFGFKNNFSRSSMLWKLSSLVSFFFNLAIFRTQPVHDLQSCSEPFLWISNFPFSLLHFSLYTGSKHTWILRIFFFWKIKNKQTIKQKYCVYFEKRKKKAHVLKQSQVGCLKYWYGYRRSVDRMIAWLCVYLSFLLFSNETSLVIYAGGKFYCTG